MAHNRPPMKGINMKSLLKKTKKLVIVTTMISLMLIVGVTIATTLVTMTTLN